MAAPLYKDLNMPKQCLGHYGLWFERFFNQYSPHDWKLGDSTEKSKWVLEFNNKTIGSKDVLASHAQAQITLAKALKGDALCFKALGHFVTGMGNPHPIENGFSWHPTLGVPYLTGAAVKGLIRAYLENHLELNDSEKKALFLKWFGSTSKDPSEADYTAQAGSLIFFDALPIQPVKLGVDIMTPHMGDWYAKGAKTPNQATTVPADWHSPVPIPFLAAQEITLLFSFALRPTAQSDGAIDLTDVAHALEQALLYAGAGGKTSTGYGGFALATDALQTLTVVLERQQKEQQEQLEKAKLASEQAAYLSSLSPLEQELEKIGQISAWVKALESGQWQGEISKEAAQAIKQRMQVLKKWVEKSAARKPEKDKDYQNTLKVMKYL